SSNTFSNLPVSKASTSMVALSVSTSAMASPLCTESPGLFSQRSNVPSSMVSLKRGITISTGIIPPLLDNPANRLDHVGYLGQCSFLQIFAVGHGHVFGSHTLDWSIQFIKPMRLNGHTNFCGQIPGMPGLGHNYHPMRLSNRL